MLYIKHKMVNYDHDADDDNNDGDDDNGGYDEDVYRVKFLNYFDHMSNKIKINTNFNLAFSLT